MLLGPNSNSNFEIAAANYATDKVDPGFIQGTAAGLLNGVTATQEGANNLFHYLTNQPMSADEKKYQDIYNTLDTVSADTTGFNGVSNTVANIAGFMLNPVNIATFEAGSGAIGLRSKLLGYGGDIAEKGITPTILRATGGALGGATGAVLPAIAGNYNQDTNDINWAGVGKGVALGSGLGLAVSTIPFALGLLKSRRDNGLNITPEEEAFTNNISDNTPQNNLKTAQNIVTKYNDNPNVEVQGRETNIKLADEQDISNIQSGFAENIVAKGEIDPNLTEAFATPSFQKVLSDPQLVNTLNNTLDHIQNSHDELQANQNTQIAATVQDLKPFIQKLTDNPEILKDNNFQNVLDDPNVRSKLKEENDNVLAHPEENTTSDLENAQKLNQFLDTDQKLKTYRQDTQAIKDLLQTNKFQGSDADVTSQFKNYVQAAQEDSEPFQKARTQQPDDEKIQEHAQIKNGETLEPEDLIQDASALKEPLRQTIQALESLKSTSSKVFNQFMKCLMENR